MPSTPYPIVHCENAYFIQNDSATALLLLHETCLRGLQLLRMFCLPGGYRNPGCYRYICRRVLWLLRTFLDNFRICMTACRTYNRIMTAGKLLSSGNILLVTVLAVIFKFGDAQITGWTKPSAITGASGTATGISKAEDVAVNSEIAEFTATPTGSDTISSYELLTTNTPFEMSAAKLNLKSALNFESASSYVIKVKATDSASNVGTATVTITITDVNEAAPAFGKTSYTVCVADGSAAGTSVTTFSATDQDTANTITYSVNSGDTNTDFKVSTAKLEVNTGKTLAMSTTAKYTLVVHATDNGSPAKTGTSTYTVNVQSSCNGAAALTVTLMTLLLALIVSLN
ncbi:protocadherin alpha-3-like [Ruditapes philippinarum]|uniref:protocadherin alpha-3-like n=1 Tax=Ruditapes philippinarum TaxID=129788 RepID=UPI00295BCDBC|nr:protocadherin alpha-3-like [Ruditapes philippinarum]